MYVNTRRTAEVNLQVRRVSKQGKARRKAAYQRPSRSVQRSYMPHSETHPATCQMSWHIIMYRPHPYNE